MKDDNLKQNTNTSEDIKLYGEKICNIQARLKNILNDMLYKEYGCHRNFQSTFPYVQSTFFDCYQPDIDINEAKLAENYITDKDCENIINFVTAQILYEWLCKDNNAQETINDFATQYNIERPHPNITLVAKNEMRSPASQTTDSIRKGMERAYKKYYNNWLISEQILNIEKKQPKNASKFLNFPFLTILYWLNCSDFRFLDLLQNKKEILKIQNKSNNQPLRDAFKLYFDLLSGLESDFVDNRSYVVSAMAIMELEQALYTTLFLYLAYLIELYKPNNKAKTDTNKRIFEERKQIMASFWFSFMQKQTVQYLLPDKELFENRHFYLMRYQYLASTLSICNDNKNFNSAYDKNIIYRCLTNDLLAIYKITASNYGVQYINDVKLFIAQPEDKLKIPFWTSKDYDHTATFFKNKYPIIKQHPLNKFNDSIVSYENWSYKMLEMYRKLFGNKLLDHLHYIRSIKHKVKTKTYKKKNKSGKES